MQGREDTAKKGKLKNYVGRMALLEVCKEGNLIDVWRALNPNKKNDSRVQRVENSWTRTRIDLLLVSVGLLARVDRVSYEPCAFSDHLALVSGLAGQGWGDGVEGMEAGSEKNVY